MTGRRELGAFHAEVVVGMATAHGRARMEAVGEGAKVTPLEIFFDLVFVFALTQVTEVVSHDLTVQGVVRGLLLMGLLWWSWVGYAWLFNVIRADEGVARAVAFAAMAAMFLLALTIPEAFHDLPGGLPGPVVVALCYFAFRMLHLLMFFIVAGQTHDAGLRGQVLRFTPSVLGGTLLLLVASQLEGGAQTAMWAAALVADYVGTFLGGASGWRLRSAGHFAERHGLILIVALGESIVAIGVGIAQLPISWPIVAASVLGLTVSAALWWTYFDVTALMAEQALAATPDADRPRLARDAYSFLHLPLMIGVVSLALGLKKVLEYVGDTEHHHLTDPLTGVGLYALYGGVALFLLAHVGFNYRCVRDLNRPRIVAAVVLLALLPLAAQMPALAALTMLAAVSVILVVVETRMLAAERDRIRHAPH